MGLTTKILLAVVILHFIVGIAWLIIKLSPRDPVDEDHENEGPI